MLSVQTLTFKKMWHHLRTVQTHRKWARYYCFLAGIPWRGIKHDLSKYSPTEFFESARYWTGTGSPINEAKKDIGYSKAWFHHRGRNRHHWAYWTDNFSEGLTVHQMPQDDFVEMVCDFLAAGRAYRGKDFTYHGEYEWWLKNKEKGNKAMHPNNKRMLDVIFHDLACAEETHMAPMWLDKPSTPEELIKTGYIQHIYQINKG